MSLFWMWAMVMICLTQDRKTFWVNTFFAITRLTQILLRFCVSLLMPWAPGRFCFNHLSSWHVCSRRRGTIAASLGPGVRVFVHINLPVKASILSTLKISERHHYKDAKLAFIQLCQTWEVPEELFHKLESHMPVVFKTRFIRHERTALRHVMWKDGYIKFHQISSATTLQVLPS